jgi:serine/threonine protein kinase
MTELPTTFGKYFLTEKLATGGMAEIYLAKLVGPGGFEKQLVIKQIHPKLSGQRHFVDLFVTEAKTLVTLTHGNIVPVYELGVIDDTYFIAMEYIDGPTLYRLTEALARQDARMDPPLAAWICARVIEGLDYAHRKGEGVIHRDLSPRNVMMSRDGDVKLVDFGIAVTLGTEDEGEDVQSAPTGSFPYMSPEQVRREALSGQTDLFSAGVLLWEMLVGERLFARKDPDATLAAVTNEPIVRPSEKRPGIPAKLEEVAMRALERDLGARWSSAGEMLAQLNKYIFGLEEPPGPRDVAALVAKYCPPETRRMPTHADPVPDNEAAPPVGPRTAVIPRDAAGPKGNAKPARARTETFATNVELKSLLERATPLFPIPAITDEPEPESEPSPRTSQRAIPRAEREAERDAQRGPLPVPGRTPPGRAFLVVAALGTLALGGAAIAMFLRAKNPDAVDAGMPMLDAAAMIAIDAPDIDTLVPLDAAELIDAEPLHDAAGRLDARMRPDAREAIAVTIDAAPRPAGNGILKIGADPWGEVVVDGIARGRTPAELVLPAGKHVIEIVFKGEDPPRSQKKTVELKAGETQEVQADFTK